MNDPNMVTIKVKRFTPRGQEDFTRGEIKRLRKYLAGVHGNGPRAQQRIRESMAKVLAARATERAYMRSKGWLA